MTLQDIFYVKKFNKNKDAVRETAHKIYVYLEKHELAVQKQVFAGSEEYLEIKIKLLLENVILPNISAHDLKETNLENLRETLCFFANLTTYSDEDEIRFSSFTEAQTLGEHYTENTVSSLYILEGMVQDIIDDPIILQKYALYNQVKELEKILHTVKAQSTNVINKIVLENWETSLSESKRTLQSSIQDKTGEVPVLRKDIVSTSLAYVKQLQDVQYHGTSLLSYLTYLIKNLFNQSSFAKSKSAFKDIFGTIEDSEEPVDLPIPDIDKKFTS